MQQGTSRNCSVPAEQAALSPVGLIWQDILAQAMTGELVVAMNYTALWSVRARA